MEIQAATSRTLAPHVATVRLPFPRTASRPAYDMGGASASQGILGIQDALNAAWAAKDAAGYAAPFAEDANIISAWTATPC